MIRPKGQSSSTLEHGDDILVAEDEDGGHSGWDLGERGVDQQGGTAVASESQRRPDRSWREWRMYRDLPEICGEGGRVNNRYKEHFVASTEFAQSRLTRNAAVEHVREGLKVHAKVSL
jgi:hypothetical protein